MLRHTFVNIGLIQLWDMRYLVSNHQDYINLYHITISCQINSGCCVSDILLTYKKRQKYVGNAISKSGKIGRQRKLMHAILITFLNRFIEGKRVARPPAAPPRESWNSSRSRSETGCPPASWGRRVRIIMSALHDPSSSVAC